MSKLRTPRAARRPRTHPSSLLWDLDEGTDDEAWTHPWRTWRAGARLALDLACAELDKEPGRTQAFRRSTSLRRLWAEPESNETYEQFQIFRREVSVLGELSRVRAEWFRVACLIAEGGIAYSDGGGSLYGSLMLPVVDAFPHPSYQAALVNARVRDALGVVSERTAVAAAAFRTAWSARRYRVAYALAAAARRPR